MYANTYTHMYTNMHQHIQTYSKRIRIYTLTKLISMHKHIHIRTFTNKHTHRRHIHRNKHKYTNIHYRTQMHQKIHTHSRICTKFIRGCSYVISYTWRRGSVNTYARSTYRYKHTIVVAQSGGAVEYFDCTFADCPGYDIKQYDGEVQVML